MVYNQAYIICTDFQIVKKCMFNGIVLWSINRHDPHSKSVSITECTVSSGIKSHRMNMKNNVELNIQKGTQRAGKWIQLKHMLLKRLPHVLHVVLYIVKCAVFTMVAIWMWSEFKMKPCCYIAVIGIWPPVHWSCSPTERNLITESVTSTH